MSDLPHIYTPSKSKETILFAEDLRVYYPLRRTLTEVFKGKPRTYVKAVDGVSFDVSRGEIFALAGESGCGKTTTGKAILRLTPITSGTIGYIPSGRVASTLDERNLRRITSEGHVDIASIPENLFKPFRLEIQMIWQDPYASLNPRKTVYEILKEPLDIHKIGESEDEKYDTVARVLEAVKLTPPEDFVNRYPHMLSGGQRQRVVIARALILRPALVIADEPVSMLDASIRAEVLQLMMDLKKSFGLTYIFITHDLALARYIANRLAVMYLGKIVEVGSARKVVEDPLHPYSKALVEAIPEPDPRRRFTIKEPPIKGEVPSPINIPTGCRFHPRCVALDEHPELAELCKGCEPPLVEVDSHRYVACWLYTKR